MPNTSGPYRGETVFQTIHGSRLYGFGQTITSDVDIFVVLPEPNAKPVHGVGGGVDMVSMGWNRFLNLAMAGSHQSAEALFSPYKIYGSYGRVFRPMFEQVTISGGDVAHKYERTIRKFCFGDFKKRRHAVRLALALKSIRQRGRFNPVLTEDDIDMCNGMATMFEGDELRERLGVPPSEPDM